MHHVQLHYIIHLVVVQKTLSNTYIINGVLTNLSNNTSLTPIWLAGSKILHINLIIVLSCVTIHRDTILVFHKLPRPTQPGHPPWVGAVRTGDGFITTAREENSEFCTTKCPVNRTGKIVS